MNKNRTLLTFCFFCLLTFVVGCNGGTEESAVEPHVGDPVPDTSEHPNPQTSGGVRDSEKPAEQIEPSTFQFVSILPAQSGVDFVHDSGDAVDKPFPAANGSGCGILDYDGDGRMDLFFATGRSFPLNSRTSSAIQRVYRNVGSWAFQEATAATGLGHDGYGTGVAVGDVNSDGFSDVYLTCYGSNQLFLNLGDGTFSSSDVVDGGTFSTSAAFLDFDSDGLLDLYVCNYGEWTYEGNQFCGDHSRNVRIFCSPKSLKPEADRLLKNSGNDSFQVVPQVSETESPMGRAQGVLASDVDGDGKTDLYIGNDIHPNFLYVNTGNGLFTDLTDFSGAAYDRNGRMQAGMGVAGGDVNRDGRWDLFVTNFEDEYNTLYLQNSPSDFHDVSDTSGLAAASRPWVGWGTAIVDFDLDGWKELIVTNGHVDNNLSDMGRDSPYAQPALVWKNHNGRFRFLGESVGEYFGNPHAGRGLATGDIDNDGDLDVVITHQDQPPGLLANKLTQENSERRQSVTIQLIGTKSNRDAIGARVTVNSQTVPWIEQIQNGGSYLSAHDSRLVLGTSDGSSLSIRVDWPSGIHSNIENLRSAGRYRIVEPTSPEDAALVLSIPD